MHSFTIFTLLIGLLCPTSFTYALTPATPSTEIQEVYNTFCDNETTHHLLVHAIKRGDTEHIECLIKAGADVNATWDEKGKTVLMLAVEIGQLGPIKQLIAAGAHVNACDEDGETALMKAADIGNGMILVRGICLKF